MSIRESKIILAFGNAGKFWHLRQTAHLDQLRKLWDQIRSEVELRQFEMILFSFLEHQVVNLSARVKRGENE